MIRKPAVAGSFYPSSPSDLTEEVNGYVVHDAVKDKAIGIVSPHAGLMYSGAVAGAVYSRIKFPSTFIILSPNHTGLGSAVSMMASGEWQLPTGSLKIDEGLAKKILKASSLVEEDTLAHTMEHSIEVQLPFIIHFSSEVNIVPVTIMSDSAESCRMLGESLADAIHDTDYPVTIIASSDMSHYEEDSVARAKDNMAIQKIMSLDAEGLYRTVKKEHISMCGYAPVTAMLHAANRLGAKEARLVKYMTSGDVSGDYKHVVGYAGVIVK
ncbi:MAG: AmmeMemoRadiSam system protein B [Nitrospirae bacterium]|nr:AmmeMemoRadiSam system protein B [Nitrospirota bacterium]